MMSGRRLLGTTLGLAQPFSQLPLRNIQRSFHSSFTLADRPNYRQLLQGIKSETQVDAKLLMDSIKDLQAHKLIVPQTVTGLTLALKDAHRTLSQLIHDKQNDEAVSLAELKEVISPTSSAFWLLVVDLVKDGQSSILAKLTDEQRARVLFTRVHGIGPKFAATFAAAGARSLDDLVKSEELEFGRRISHKQKLAIEHFDDMERLIPRPEVEEIKKRFAQILEKVGPKYKFEVMGSYRRGELFSSDVDIVVSHQNFTTMYGESNEAKMQKLAGEELFRALVEQLFEAGFLFKDKVFSHGAKKLIALTRAGSGVWRQMLRVKARRQGLVMNEYTMAKAVINEQGYNTTQLEEGTHVPAKTERDIFRKLGLPYLEPEDRSFRKYKEIRLYAGMLQSDLD